MILAGPGHYVPLPPYNLEEDTVTIIYGTIDRIPNYVNPNVLVDDPDNVILVDLDDLKFLFGYANEPKRILKFTDTYGNKLLIRANAEFVWPNIGEIYFVPLKFFNPLTGKFFVIKLADTKEIVYIRVFVKAPLYYGEDIKTFSDGGESIIFLTPRATRDQIRFKKDRDPSDGIFIPHTFLKKV